MSEFKAAVADPAPGLVPCPQCTEAVVDLDEHLKWCGAAEPQPEPEAGQEPETETGADEPAAAVEQAESAEEDGEAYAERVDAARALIAADEQRRMAACLAEIEAALARHRMALDVTPARAVLRPTD